MKAFVDYEDPKTHAKFLEEIGAKLTALRRKKGYSSHENFALDNDIPRGQYWRLEKGKANFTIKTLSKILKIHGLTLVDFFCDKSLHWHS